MRSLKKIVVSVSDQEWLWLPRSHTFLELLPWPVRFLSDQSRRFPPHLDQIKNGLVSLMISVPYSLQLQLSEAVTLIADNDFPAGWPTLIQVCLFLLSCVFISCLYFALGSGWKTVYF
jgi:hypothetical protein